MFSDWNYAHENFWVRTKFITETRDEAVLISSRLNIYVFFCFYIFVLKNNAILNLFWKFIFCVSRGRRKSIGTICFEVSHFSCVAQNFNGYTKNLLSNLFGASSMWRKQAKNNIPPGRPLFFLLFLLSFLRNLFNSLWAKF